MQLNTLIFNATVQGAAKLSNLMFECSGHGYLKEMSCIVLANVWTDQLALIIQYECLLCHGFYHRSYGIQVITLQVIDPKIDKPQVTQCHGS